MTDEVRYERRGSAALLTIDRPARRNAVDGPTAERLLAAFEAFEADDDARVLVLTGGGDIAFCAGADLKAIGSFADRLEAAQDAAAERLGADGGPLGFSRLTPSKPTIAAISGWCLAGGLELALWCDLRIATEGARLGFPERRWGVPLIDGGTQRLPRIVGLGRALELAMGLVTEVVADGRHVERALELAAGLAGFPQATMLADRRAALEAQGLPLEAGLALEAQGGPALFADAIAGAARFAAGEGRGGAGAGI
jgi:enoyl-CoA hydratase